MSEHSEQTLVFAWASLNEGRFPDLKLLHAVQNWAGVKSGLQGARRKREGVKAGVPDIHLPVARGGFHSLYVEMKTVRVRVTKKGITRTPTKPTDAQVEWQMKLRTAGNAVAVCTEAESAQAIIEEYLRGEWTHLLPF